MVRISPPLQKTARENVVEEIYDDVEEESEVEDDATLGAAG